MSQTGRSSTVFLVDDDPSVRKALTRLMRVAGYQVEAFASARDFLEWRNGPDRGSGCLILDVRMPGLSGLDLQQRMADLGLDIPVVFLTGQGNIPASVKAMKAGAIEFLTKPVDEQNLLKAIEEAIERDRRTRLQQTEMHKLRQRYESLTAREQEVMQLVISGLLNKQIAGELTITEDTVKFHRGHVMRKMCAESLADLVRMAENLGVRSNK